MYNPLHTSVKFHPQTPVIDRDPYTTTFGSVVSTFDAVHGALSLEPDIKPDLSSLSFLKLPTVLAVMMNQGITRLEDMDRYLMDRGAIFEDEEIEFVLARFEGKGPECLWFRTADGQYLPTIYAI